MPHLINNTHDISYMKQAQELPANGHFMYKYIPTREWVCTCLSTCIWSYIGINQRLRAGGACAPFIIYYNIKLLSMHKYIYVYISIY